MRVWAEPAVRFDVSFLIALPVSLGLGWGIQKVFATSDSCVDRPEP